VTVVSEADGERASTLVSQHLLQRWPVPEPTGGKESRGRVLLIGGSPETVGGVLLAAEAALRAGAGKLQVATARDVAPLAAVALPEALVRALPQTPDGALDPDGADAVAELAADAAVVLIGPGMTGSEASARLVARLLPSIGGAVVLDALALACVTGDATCLHHLDQRAVLTPNPPELALTLGIEVAEVEDDPGGAALALAARAGATVGVGGSTSWIASPSGQLWRDESGGAGLGVSGSGDVRAGITAGLLARGAEPDQAAVWAAHLHGRAGERLAAAVGKLGFLARELPLEVPRVVAEIEL
jgi:ADP-dependent NAD(P)H-hydrate dehydratase